MKFYSNAEPQPSYDTAKTILEGAKVSQESLEELAYAHATLMEKVKSIIDFSFASTKEEKFLVKLLMELQHLDKEIRVENKDV